MFAIPGAPLDEVWGTKQARPTRPKQVTKRTNTGPTKMYDDIIDAYIDDFQMPCDQAQITKDSPKHKRQVNILPDNDFYDVSPYFEQKQSMNQGTGGGKQRCSTNVTPVMSSDYAEDALEYQNFYKGDNMFARNEQPTDQTISEEHNSQIEDSGAVGQEGAMMPHQYTYQEHNRYPQNYNTLETPSIHSQILELALYVMSGVILIFLLEQILHLGLYLR